MVVHIAYVEKHYQQEEFQFLDSIPQFLHNIHFHLIILQKQLQIFGSIIFIEILN
ncbi:unnamed protein product [Paramecium sonneborni]|uniref:Uncharacterized protein n=1 Tax=Paramecium sonneborni TaxID=65129 RepID=A0A8S1R5I6_9CILI|nr:unnamed protein product [Paramecium sonneborni]